MNDRVAKLEQVENALIDRLKHTHGKQQMAYKDLEKIVHDGYGYYLSSFKEKRDRHSSLYKLGQGSKSAMKSSSRNDSVLGLNHTSSSTQINSSIAINHNGNHL